MRFLSLLWILCGWAMAQNKVLVATKGNVAFFSSTPVEDISAKNDKVVSSLDTATGALVVKLKNKDFQFPNKLMQEHFNENYMESDKYPVAEFKGTLTGYRQAQANGKTETGRFEGQLTIHGVTKTYSAPALLARQKEGHLAGEVKFKVRVADHGIQVPKLVFSKIAEEIEITARLIWK